MLTKWGVPMGNGTHVNKMGRPIGTAAHVSKSGTRGGLTGKLHGNLSLQCEVLGVLRRLVRDPGTFVRLR